MQCGMTGFEKPFTRSPHNLITLIIKTMSAWANAVNCLKGGAGFNCPPYFEAKKFKTTQILQEI